MTLRSGPQRNKTSNLPSGVSVFLETGRRGSQPSVTFGVYFRRSGQPDVRKFRAGVDANEATIEHTRKTALAFREAYNRAVEAGEPFDPTPFTEWRTRLVSDSSKDRTPKN